MAHPTPPRTIHPLDLADLDDLLSDEEKAIRDTVRRVCAEHVDPYVAEWFEKGELPHARELARTLGEVGLLDITPNIR